MDNLNEKEPCSNPVLRSAAFYAMLNAGLIETSDDGKVNELTIEKFDTFWHKFDESVKTDFENRRQELAQRIFEKQRQSENRDAAENPSGCGLCFFAFLAGLFTITLLRLAAKLIGLS